MLTRNRTKGQSSSDAQNSQFRSAQGRRGGTMGVPGKVPVLQYCSWKASWGRRGGLSARPRGPGSSELRVLQAPGAVPLPHLAVPPRGDMERQGHRSSATKSWGASQPALASSDWAGERPEAQVQGAGTASQAIHTGQGDEGGAALSQAPAPGCRRGLSSDGPPKLNSVCARPGLTARRVCVLRLCRTFTPRRGGGWQTPPSAFTHSPESVPISHRQPPRKHPAGWPCQAGLLATRLSLRAPASQRGGVFRKASFERLKVLGAFL